MAKFTALFDTFDNLDQIPIENIAFWLKPTPNLIQLENYLANKILYPKSLPLSEPDMRVDLAILREALKLNNPKLAKETLLGLGPFLNITLRKILIPQRFLEFIPNLPKLVWVFVDALVLARKKEDWFADLWTVVLTGDVEEVAGSVLRPQFRGDEDWMDLLVLGKVYKIRQGSLMVLACPGDRCQISYKLREGKFLGKNEAALEVYGGKLGLMVDGRNL
ncbi:hypothetical protein HYZ05_00070 [Candidatus Daviesbacteria bacterium]|nr:hypothetical protein [Candidatus Daviesbacteria bacterium]